jgi:hypothetical protein
MISKEELAKTIPVSPPTVNKKIKPRAQRVEGVKLIRAPCSVPSHLKILIPVGMAIVMVATVKYARVSASIPTVNM